MARGREGFARTTRSERSAKPPTQEGSWVLQADTTWNTNAPMTKWLRVGPEKADKSKRDIALGIHKSSRRWASCPSAAPIFPAVPLFPPSIAIGVTPCGAFRPPTPPSVRSPHAGSRRSAGHARRAPPPPCAIRPAPPASRPCRNGSHKAFAEVAICRRRVGRSGSGGGSMKDLGAGAGSGGAAGGGSACSTWRRPRST